MSSIQSFLRQRNPATSLTKPPGNNGCYYTFVADNGNYVGNYPPGYMVPVAVTVIPANIDTYINVLMRDMGKTIKAPLGVIANTPIVNPAATSGFFREIQLIEAFGAGTAQGNTFGVGNQFSGNAAGPNAGNAGYGTYYIPTVIDGTLATDGAGGVAKLSEYYHPAGQQM
jgi:hypothetical protein